MLSKSQKRILDYIKCFQKKKGYTPSMEEIGKNLRLSSVSTVHYHLSELEEQGYISREDNQPRNIKVHEKEQMVQIPILGTITAGQPVEAIEDREETISVPKSRLPRSGEFYTLRVEGNSMIDEDINNGDLVIAKKQNTAENGSKIIALIDNYETTLKTFYKEKDHIRLQPANKKLNPIIVNKDQDFEVQGIVIDIIRNLQRPNKPTQGKIITKTRKQKVLPQKEVKRFNTLPLNKIICGDAVEIMKAMPPNSIDLVVTSPPYDELRDYKSYTFNFEGMAKGLFRVIKKGGVLVWVVGDKIKKGNRSLTSFRQALFFQNIGFNVHDVMIYKKKNTPFMRSNAYTNCYEFMLVLSKGSPKTFNLLKTKTVRQGQEMLPFNKKADGINKKVLGELKLKKTMTNIWEYAVGLHGSTSDKIAFQHTAIFPEKLAEDHIISWTKTGDVVLDPMCGSGTTCKMAAINKRYYIGCDTSKEYIDLTKKRLKYLNL